MMLIKWLCTFNEAIKMMHFIKEKCVRNHYLADKLQTSGNWLAAWPGSLAVTSQIRQRVLCVRGTGSEGTHCLQGLRNNCKACRSFQFVPQVPATVADCRSNVPIPPTGAGSSPRAPPPHPPLCGARCYMHERCLRCQHSMHGSLHCYASPGAKP